MNRTLLGTLAILCVVATAPSLFESDEFNFSLSSSSTLSVSQGASATEIVTATLSAGSPEPIEFAAAELPPGATYLFSTAVCRPNCTSLLTIRTTGATPPGRYQVNVTAIGAGRTRFAPLTLNVTAAPAPLTGLFDNYNRVVTNLSTVIHTGPSTSSSAVATLPAGAVGTIAAGPISADGSVWWNVTYDTGVTGWTSQEILTKESTAVAVRGDCSSEGGLIGRTDLIFCEPWEDPAWWQNGYVAEGEKTRPRPATPGRVARTVLTSVGCISGMCLEVNMRKGEAGSLAVHWPLAAARLHPEELFLRYYLKLGPGFDPNVCGPDGAVVDSGGKFPGPADVRTNADPGGQCGNGGNPSDGLHCWSLRSKFRNCYGGSSGSACATRGATTRFGHYAYFPGSRDFWGVSGYWDTHPYDQSTGEGGTCRTIASNLYCGIAGGGLLPERWYRIEMHVKMNSPGRADGILEGWLDGQKVFLKSNMIYRFPGHDDLHVRTMWLNIHTGGDYPNGNCRDQKVWLDQMVLAAASPVGAWKR